MVIEFKINLVILNMFSCGIACFVVKKNNYADKSIMLGRPGFTESTIDSGS